MSAGAYLVRVIGSREAPPVPATVRVGRIGKRGGGLRVEHDQVVGVGPGVVPGIIHVLRAHVAIVLGARPSWY